MASAQKALEDLKLSDNEVERLAKAFKNEEFRKMFKEYAEEISDPENRRRYEEEIAMMENERGMNVDFVHPEPGYVVKTTVDGDKKAFVNVCKSDKIDKPKAERSVGPDGKAGLAWSIPHSFAPARDDLDKKGAKCKVFDFVVHPDTYRMAEKNARFRDMIHNTALDGIEKQFNFVVDRNNLSFPKMKFKGTPAPTVIRSRIDSSEQKANSNPDMNSEKNSFPYPYENKTTKEISDRKIAEASEKRAKDSQTTIKPKNKQKDDDGYTMPKYTIKHRSEIDFQHYTNAPDAKTSTRPNELVVEIELPLIQRASNVDLDIYERSLSIKSETPAKYKLELSLPYPVDENEGSAKFDKRSKKLTVMLPVLPEDNLPSLSTDVVVNGCDNEDDGVMSNNPLIEVLSDSTSTSQANTEEPLSPDPVTDIPENTDTSTPSLAMVNGVMTPATFDYLQTDENVTLILHAGKVQKSSVKLTFPDGSHSVNIEMTSVGSGGFSIHYCLYAKFSAEHTLETENCYADVDSENVVVVLVKSDASLGHWDRFEAGKDADSLEEKFFLTRANLQNQLYDLSPEDGSASPPTGTDMEVTEMDGDKLIVSIKEQARTGRKKKHLSESADDIEVVHQKGIPPELKSIIKQRSHTASESSEDFLSSSCGRQNSTTSFNGSDSSVGDSDENEGTTGRKKTVSFNEHIDKTTYKSNQSVCSMRSTLKNKRKKHRQAERRQQEKQLRRSRKNSGSEGPSSDDSGAKDDIIPNHTKPLSLNSDSMDDHPLTDDQMLSATGVEGDDELSPTVDKTVKHSKSKNKMTATEQLNSGTDEGDETMSTEPSDSEGSELLTNNSQKETVCLSNGKAKPGVNNTNLDSSHKTSQISENRSSADIDSDDCDPVREVECPKSKTSLIQELDPESSRDREGIPDGKLQDSPNAAMSWEDGRSAEHSTTCALDFTNSVMFDLDLDA